jgi:N-acetylglucosamine-1-phosphate transferase gamma subunit
MRFVDFAVLLAFPSVMWQSDANRMTAMKVVDEPTNYGANLLHYQADVVHQRLKARVAPSNFSGPSHLSRLRGKCFSTISGDYKYELCPFANATQHEQVLRWNAYSGVLGVWQEWNIENNTFTAMMMQNGDTCGSNNYRSIEVKLVCSNHTRLSDVSEPRMCEYVAHLQTPLVCNPDSMLVYPTLGEDLQRDWDVLEGLRLEGFITDKGYKNRLHELFVRAGYQTSQEQREALRAQVKGDTSEQKARHRADDFVSLFECRTEYSKLQKRIRDLEDVLKQNGITVSNTTEIASLDD